MSSEPNKSSAQYVTMSVLSERVAAVDLGSYFLQCDDASREPSPACTKTEV